MKKLTILLGALFALLTFATAADNGPWKALRPDLAALPAMGPAVPIAPNVRLVPVALPTYQVQTPAPSWGAIYNYDLATRTSAAFVGYRLTPLEVFSPESKFSASLWAVAGSQIDGSPSAGFAATVDYNVIPNAWLTGGLSWTKPFEDSPTKWGVVLGWRVEVRL